MALQSQKRMVEVPTFERYVHDLVSNMRALHRANKAGRVSPVFRERIMLAVTEVNGCRYCSYAHTGMALKTGMSEQEVEGMLGGDISTAPEWERVALLYAQHYAESGGQPDPEADARLVHLYGEELARDIRAYASMMMVANIMGIALERFLNRFRGRNDGAFTIWQELGVLLGLPLFVAASLLDVGIMI